MVRESIHDIFNEKEHGDEIGWPQRTLELNIILRDFGNKYVDHYEQVESQPHKTGCIYS